MKTSSTSIRAMVDPAKRVLRLMVAIVLSCALVSPTRAALLDDVFDVVNNIWNRVSDIRTRVIDLQSDMGDVQTRVQSIQNNVVSTVTNVLDVRGRVENVQIKIDDMTNNIAELMGNLRSGVAVLAGNTLSLVTNAITDVQQRVADELEGFEDFDGAPAEQFRTDLVAFLTNLESIINSVSSLTGNSATFDLARARNLISNAGPKALYPLYRALQVSVNFAEISATLADAAAKLATLQTVFDASGGTACAVIQANPVLVQAAATGTKKISMGLSLTGKKLEGLGENGSDIDVGLWGFVHVNFKVNTIKSMGKILGGLASTLEKVSEVVEEKMTYCEILDRHNLVVAKLASVQSDMTALDTMIAARASQSSVDGLGTMVSSRASQSSVDALATTLGTLDTAPLDVAVSTRASQAGLDVLATAVDTHQSMVLRMQVELQLSDNTRTPSVLYLPEARGGQLAFVRAVVAETLATNIAAGLYSGSIAGQLVTEGDAAAGTNDFRGAFDNYRRAYQEIVKLPVTASIDLGEDLGALALSWPSDEGGIYCVESSTDLANWSPVVPKIVGTLGQTEISLTATGTKGFYRVFRLSSYDPTVNGS